MFPPGKPPLSPTGFSASSRPRPCFPPLLEINQSELIENDKRRLLLHLDEAQHTLTPLLTLQPCALLTFNLARHQLTLHQLFRRFPHSTDASAHFSALTFADTANSFHHSSSFQLNSWSRSIQVIQTFKPLLTHFLRPAPTPSPLMRGTFMACIRMVLMDAISHLNSSLPLCLCFHLSRRQTHLAPAHGANSLHRPNGHHGGSAPVEGCMEDYCAGGPGATASSQTGAGFRGSTEEPPQEDPSSYPPCLDTTLQHIVRQLDILTQVSDQFTSK